MSDTDVVSFERMAITHMHWLDGELFLVKGERCPMCATEKEATKLTVVSVDRARGVVTLSSDSAGRSGEPDQTGHNIPMAVKGVDEPSDDKG